MTGTAPGAKIYAMKVFPATGGGAPESRIIAAMDRAITLRRNYNSTGVNTGRLGNRHRDRPVRLQLVEDRRRQHEPRRADALCRPRYRGPADARDARRSASRSSPRPATTATRHMTGGSPGTGFGSLTTARRQHRGPRARPARQPVRVWRRRDLPADHAHADRLFQLARPTADGRIDPDITANGFASFTRAFTWRSRPPVRLVDCREPAAVPGTCARADAVRRLARRSPRRPWPAPRPFCAAAHPTKNATQIRNALQRSANPTALGDGSTRIDQGNGLLDVAAADALLRSGKVSSQCPRYRQVTTMTMTTTGSARAAAA